MARDIEEIHAELRDIYAAIHQHNAKRPADRYSAKFESWEEEWTWLCNDRDELLEELADAEAELEPEDKPAPLSKYARKVAERTA